MKLNSTLHHGFWGKGLCFVVGGFNFPVICSETFNAAKETFALTANKGNVNRALFSY